MASYLKTNTAVTISLGPFLDKTDGITPETALTVSNCRITAIAETDDNSAPTLVLDNVAGNDATNTLAHITGDDAGYYSLKLTAANVNRLGRFTVQVNDVANHCPVWKEYMILPAVIYDSQVLGTDLFQVDVTQLLGTAWLTPGTAGTPDVNVKLISADATAADNAEAFFDGTGYAGTNNVIPTVTTATNVTTVNGLAANVITAASMAADASAEIADAVWDEDATGHQTGGTFGQAIGDPGADTTTIYQSVVTDAAGTNIAADIIAIEAQTDDIGAAGAGLTAVPWNAAWDAEVQSEVDDALVVQRLDELLNADSDIDGAAPPTVGSVFHELMTKTTGSFTYDQTTDSNEALRDNLATASALATVQADTDNIQTRIPAALSGDGFMKADLLSIGDELVSGNNATLNLKHLSIISSDGNAALQVETQDFQNAIVVIGGLRGMYIEGDSGPGLSLYGVGGPGILAEGDTNFDGIKAVGAGTGKSIYAAQDIAVSDGSLTLAAIAAAVWASVIETGFTALQSMRLMLSALAGKLSGAATTTVTIRDVNDSKDRIVATVDADGNRTAVTKDVS